MSNPFVPIFEADRAQGKPRSFSTDPIFVEGNNLTKRWAALPKDQHSKFHIAEIGFGAGLNFLLTWKHWQCNAPKQAHLHFISCEKHPLKIADLERCLSNWPGLEAQQLLENYPTLTPGFHQIEFNDSRVTLTLLLGDPLGCYEQLLICGDMRLEAELRVAFIDAWYVNGPCFSEEKSFLPKSLVSVLAQLSRKNTTLVIIQPTGLSDNTHQKMLSSFSFVNNTDHSGTGEPLSTHPNQIGRENKSIKTEFWVKDQVNLEHCTQRMCREQFAIKPLKRHTPWQYSFSVQSKEKTAIILGAGLAGCFTANALAKRGWSITLIEELDEVGSWGSANEQAILFPKLSAYKSPFTEFMLSAFLYASQCYRSILKQFACGEMNGSLVLAHNEKEIKAQDSLKNWLSHYPELGVLVDAHTASQLSGLPLTRSGLFIPHSGWMNSPDLCKFLINSPEISLVLHQHINSLVHDGVNWKINDKTSPILILATGNKVNSFVETEYLPIQSMRGQISRIKSTNLSSELKIPVCAEGHVLPQKNGTHLFGATYELESKPLLNPEDDLANFAKLSRTVPENIWSKPIISHWAGIRASTPDYLPLVGPVAKLEEFITQFKSLEEDSKRWIGNSGPYYPGLYTCAGFGSRGLTTIPLCSEWLASVINREVGCLPRHLIQAIAPARFLRKDIIFKRSLKAKKD